MSADGVAALTGMVAETVASQAWADDVALLGRYRGYETLVQNELLRRCVSADLDPALEGSRGGRSRIDLVTTSAVVEIKAWYSSDFVPGGLWDSGKRSKQYYLDLDLAKVRDAQPGILVVCSMHLLSGTHKKYPVAKVRDHMSNDQARDGAHASLQTWAATRDVRPPKRFNGPVGISARGEAVTDAFVIEVA